MQLQLYTIKNDLYLVDFACLENKKGTVFDFLLACSSIVSQLI